MYDTMCEMHFANYRQMFFMSGPRQTGKTTIAKAHSNAYLSWDDESVRYAIMSGQQQVKELCDKAGVAGEGRKIVAFDEIHKYVRWKNFLKGFFDIHESELGIIATGSAKMDVYKRGGDSMMGRYFPYRIHPLSVAELLDVGLPGERILKMPRKIDDASWEALWRFGGFPEPLLRNSQAFSNRWNSLRREQLLRTDARDLTRIEDLDRLIMLSEVLSNRSGEMLNYSALGNEVRADEKTVKNWVSVLKHLFYGFEIKPWFKNVENSLRKTPKWYLRDWGTIGDEGKRFETMVACHLLKAVEAWTDLGLGDFELFYLRDKRKREVDFLVSRDGVPWFLAEAKNGDRKVSDSLQYFQKTTGAQIAVQVVKELPYREMDISQATGPVCVSARTFLSQLA